MPYLFCRLFKEVHVAIILKLRGVIYSQTLGFLTFSGITVMEHWIKLMLDKCKFCRFKHDENISFPKANYS